MARPFKLLDASQGRQRLDRYELIAELAAGGMATVYLARIGGAGGFQRFVAIKRLHPHLAHEQEFVEMFLDEARLAASIHHPNVVPILEVGESAVGYYLVMEYVEGDTLWNLRAASGVLPAGRLDPRFVLRVMVDALLGLHAAHELRDERGQPVNLVHRDVSPQNILVGADGSARIADFGVAKASTRLSSTRSGEIKGKMAYMAPEQIQGDAALDRRADIFAMGIVLWEALANRHLFLGANDAVTMHRVLHEEIPTLASAEPTLPLALSFVLARALDRDPARRFPTCLAMAEAIEQSVAGALTLASGREVAAVVDLLIGARLTSRRESVNSWLAGSVSQPSASATGTWGALPPPTPLPGRRPDALSSGGYPQPPSSSAGVPPSVPPFNPATGRSLVGGLEVGVGGAAGPVGAAGAGSAGLADGQAAGGPSWGKIAGAVLVPVGLLVGLTITWQLMPPRAESLGSSGVPSASALGLPLASAVVLPAVSAEPVASASASPSASSPPPAASSKAAGKPLTKNPGPAKGGGDIDDTIKNTYRR
jgi:serine/threonine-protein kinase